MGKDLYEAYPEAREVFAEIDDALSQNLYQLMSAGSESDLNLTENTQPALMAVSMAVMRVLTKHMKIDLAKNLAFMAGHSLGEYAALTAAESFDVATTARLLKLRGQAMQRAVPVGVGSMAAILGLDLPEVQKITQQATQDNKNNEWVESANDNSPGQVVISGHANAVAIAMELAAAAGAKRAVPLPVSAPFHCRLMKPAADAMATALSETAIRPPIVPIVANVTAEAVTEPHLIRQYLVDQVTGMVRWRESVMWMKDQGVSEIYELGAGKVLSGLIKRIDKEIASESINTPQQIEDLAKKLMS